MSNISAVGSKSSLVRVADFWREHRVYTILAEYPQFAVEYAPLAHFTGIDFYAKSNRIELHIVGDGELFEAAAQFVEVFSLGDSVKLHGRQPHERVREMIRTSDVFLQHSVTSRLTGDEEELPMAILEAMAAGLPVITTNHAGIPESVQDGVTGYLVAERDTQGMADRVLELAEDSQLRANMGLKAAERVRQEFTWENERQRLCSLLSPRHRVAVIGAP